MPLQQVVKENLEVIKVPQEGEDVPPSPEETVELVKLASQERVQQRSLEKNEDVPQSAEETVELVQLVKLVSQEQWQSRRQSSW